MPNTKANNYEFFDRLPWRENRTPGSIEITRTISCDWSSYNAPPGIIVDFLGLSEVVGTDLHRQLPERDPIYDLYPCKSISIVEMLGTPIDNNNDWFDLKAGGGTPPADNGKVILAVTYQDVLYDLKEDDEVDNEWERYVTQHPSYNVENLAIPGHSFKFVDGDVPIPETLARPIASQELIWTWHEVPEIPPDLDDVLGNVNADSFAGRAAETLLLTSPDIKPVLLTSTGRRGYEITYKFQYRKQTWNALPRRGAGVVFDPIISKNGGLKLYETADFSKLFTFS